MLADQADGKRTALAQAKLARPYPRIRSLVVCAPGQRAVVVRGLANALFQSFFSVAREGGKLRRFRTTMETVLQLGAPFVMAAALAWPQANPVQPNQVKPNEVKPNPAQTNESSPAGTAITSAPPQVIALPDALERARRYSGQIQTANLALLTAHEDRVQARAAQLPQLTGINQFIYTEGNGTPSGVFVANDGVHVYNEQLNAHQELLAALRHGEVHRAMAAEAVAKAKVEVAGRGLNATVIQDYYAIAVAKHKFVNAQASLGESQRFLDITQKQEQHGEAAHSDVIKAQMIPPSGSAISPTRN